MGKPMGNLSRIQSKKKNLVTRLIQKHTDPSIIDEPIKKLNLAIINQAIEDYFVKLENHPDAISAYLYLNNRDKIFENHCLSVGLNWEHVARVLNKVDNTKFRVSNKEVFLAQRRRARAQ